MKQEGSTLQKLMNQHLYKALYNT